MIVSNNKSKFISRYNTNPCTQNPAMNMDPVAASFLVFFALFFFGFVTLICFGFVIRCCCGRNIPRYRAEVTDEAIVCERLTKKERMDVFEKFFSSYDAMGERKFENEIDLEVGVGDRTIKNIGHIGHTEGRNSKTDEDNIHHVNDNSMPKNICIICLENIVITKSIIYDRDSSSKNTLFPPEDHENNINIDIMTKENELVTTPILRGFRCHHAYHRECIQPWFEQGKLSCPCCRLDLLNPQDFRQAVLSVLRKERLQMMQRWGIRGKWVSYNDN